MLYPFSPKSSDKRQRTIRETEAALALAEIPCVYIFNVGPKPWKGVGGGKEWTIPACPKGARHSEPIEVPMIVLSERDLADGGNHCDTVVDAALTGVRKVGDESKQVFGVADDIVGRNSTSPGLGIHTTNGEWFGVFVSRSEEPEEEEIEAAEQKLREMADLIYQTGAEFVQKGEAVSPRDRERYNWAATLLGRKQLWGNIDHTLSQCPECGEDIREGAKVCKHCNLAIDPASVAARAKERENHARLVLGEESEEAEPETPAQPARKSAKSGKGKNAKQNPPEFGE